MLFPLSLAYSFGFKLSFMRRPLKLQPTPVLALLLVPKITNFQLLVLLYNFLHWFILKPEGQQWRKKRDCYFVFLMMKKIRGVFRFLIFLLLSLIIFSLCRYIVQLFTDNNFFLILIPVTGLTFFALAKEYVYSLVDMMMSWTPDHPEW